MAARKKRRKTTSAARLTEFSKRFVMAVSVIWIAEAAFGAVIVWREPDNLNYLLDYIGAPMVAVIIGYMAKAAFENHQKIKNAAETQRQTPQDEP